MTPMFINIRENTTLPLGFRLGHSKRHRGLSVHERAIKPRAMIQPELALSMRLK